jgi:hypothetical protein
MSPRPCRQKSSASADRCAVTLLTLVRLVEIVFPRGKIRVAAIDAPLLGTRLNAIDIGTALSSVLAEQHFGAAIFEEADLTGRVWREI